MMRSHDQCWCHIYRMKKWRLPPDGSTFMLCSSDVMNRNVTSRIYPRIHLEPHSGTSRIWNMEFIHSCSNFLQFQATNLQEARLTHYVIFNQPLLWLSHTNKNKWPFIHCIWRNIFKSNLSSNGKNISSGKGTQWLFDTETSIPCRMVT